MPSGIVVILRTIVFVSIGVSVMLYVGFIVIAGIGLGSVTQALILAEAAQPWFWRGFAVIVLGLSVHAAIDLLLAKRNLKGTGLTLMQFMSMPLDERHALMRNLRRGPYRDA